ncbi:MAG: cation:proton antiporter [Candidatus Aenigmarchaeota archaeon]|nr:cation:proton antiporter [Candidatus Aenigmarchaeota archaeon]
MSFADFTIASSPEFQMSLLLFVAFAGYLVASRVNQSVIVAELLLGLLIGPSLLGLITYTEFVKGIAHLGAVILLFVVGLEFQLKHILNPKYFTIAIIGAIVPWIGGYLTAVLFGFDFASAIMVGTALTATSIAITAHVLKEMGKLETDAAKAIIGAAVIDDVLDLLALSFSQQIVLGTVSPAMLGLVMLKAVGFLVAGTVIGYFGVNRLVRRMDHADMAKKFPELVFIFTILFAFLYAMSAELFGLSAILGAFIAGISLEGVHSKHGKNFREGVEYLHIIFASLFFVSLGIIADLHTLNFNIITFVIALTIIAVVTKIVACGSSARLLGMNPKDSVIIGISMVPRGEVAMIVGLVALNQSIIGQDIYISIVLMSILTTVIAPVLLRNWFREKQVTDNQQSPSA